MQKHHYKIILFFISATIVITLGIQGYWNYKNYQTSKQQFINEVQIVLDNAVNTYYAEMAEDNILGFSLSETTKNMTHEGLDSIFYKIDNKFLERNIAPDDMHLEMEGSGDLKEISIFTGDQNSKHDTLFKKLKVDAKLRKNMVQWVTKDDSMQFNPLASLTTRVIYAISNDSLQLPALDSLVTKELARKNIPASYNLHYIDEKGSTQTTSTGTISENTLQTTATSSYLPKNSELSLSFNNATLVILKRNSIGLLLSFLFATAVIACLLYLLKIIKHQKQLAEVKNDLISNITHEFKTPLATIGAAMEGIKIFNKNNDPEKTMKYATVSATQVNKLNGMVEKLLETATLDSEQLQLKREPLDLVQLLENSTARERFDLHGKQIKFSTNETSVLYEADAFHFENAINNIVDNALKYGGDIINVSVVKDREIVCITIQDNGNALTAHQGKQIFDKFYRVPKGNTHDVKGFGIGLYYTKTILEKHGGSISVTVQPTTFTIDLPL